MKDKWARSLWLLTRGCFRITCSKHTKIKKKNDAPMPLGPTPDVLALDVQSTRNIHGCLTCALGPHREGWLCWSLAVSCVCPVSGELLLMAPTLVSSLCPAQGWCDPH